MIVSKPTQNALMEIIKLCFTENRVLDRLVSVLGVQYAYNNTANLIHHSIAHYFPNLSDEIGEKCLERYNIPVLYGATPAGMENYTSVEEIIKTLEERMIDFQTYFMGVCKIANDNGDIQVYTDLLGLLAYFNRIVEQAILLSDKIDIYGSNPSYDSHILNSFWILEK